MAFDGELVPVAAEAGYAPGHGGGEDYGRPVGQGGEKQLGQPAGGDVVGLCGRFVPLGRDGDFAGHDACVVKEGFDRVLPRL